MRILKAVGAKPRRTIRVALWGGEEEGLYGSRAWVAQHLAGDANKAARDKFDVYFNIDPGYGRVYGFYTQGNDAAKAIFDQWLEPFKDAGAKRNLRAGIGNTDHLSFIAEGVPGFNPGAGVLDVRRAHPPHEHGHDGAHDAGGSRAGRDGVRHVRVSGGDARRADPAAIAPR